MNPHASVFAPLAASTRDPIRLSMQRLWLTGQLLGAGARLVLQHVFRSAERRPVEVIYSSTLPRDAALRGFRIQAGDREIASALKPTEEAIDLYEKGVDRGALSALARAYRDGIVNLTLGNLRPNETVVIHLEILAGVELRDDGFRFRFPFTLAPSYHPEMRLALTDDGTEVELPASHFGDVILPPFHSNAAALHQIGFDLALPTHTHLEEIASPSHAIRVRQSVGESARVSLANAAATPDRDLVLDVRFSADAPQITSGPTSDAKTAFAIVIPSTLFGDRPAEPRRVAILIDRSGSMAGDPLNQARNAVRACLAALDADDTFALLAFDDSVEALSPRLLAAGRENREAARKFLDGIDARGGTKLAPAIEHAAQLLDGAGDLFIVTDGQVFATDDILARVRDTGIRVSCLGIGAASQDRFLTLLARETHGVSRFLTPSEPVDLAAVDLFASIGRPLASEVVADKVEPPPPPAVFAGTPLLLFGDIEADGDPRVELAWNAGRLAIHVPVGEPALGETVRLLRGARLITDTESRNDVDRKRIATRLRRLSETYGLASREMALVAVMKRPGDRPGDLPSTQVVPVGFPQGMESPEEMDRPQFLRMRINEARKRSAQRSAPSYSVDGMAFPDEAEAELLSAAPLFDRESSAPSGDTDLIELAAMLEPDGGMPGNTPEIRAARSIAAIYAFVAEGHTRSEGAFRSHVARLGRFLRRVAVASEEERRLMAAAAESARSGRAPEGDWFALACDVATDYEAIYRDAGPVGT